MRRLPPAILTALAAAALLAPAEGLAQKLVPATTSLVAHDANRVFLRVTNRGGIGLTVDEIDVGNFPIGSENRYIFGSGVWVGGIGEVDGDAAPDTVVVVGYNPDAFADIDWIEGAVGFSRDDARFRVLDSEEPTDQVLFPGDPVADQELFAMYGDRFSVFTAEGASIPLGVQVRQRSFAFDEPGLDGTVFFQWDLENVSDRIRTLGYEIRGLRTGVALDPDIGAVEDDAAAPVEIDGEEVLLIWDADFEVSFFDGPPGFLAIVPLDDVGDVVVTQMESHDGANVIGVQDVPQDDASQYRTMVGADPNQPTIRSVGFDLRAMVAWGSGVDLPVGEIHRSAAAFVFAEVAGEPPAVLQPNEEDRPTADHPALANVVAAVRAARAAYGARLANLPVLVEFPGEPDPPTPGEGNTVFQNYPNPFDAATTIEYNVVEETRVLIEVYDVTGSLVRRLVDRTTAPGLHLTSWDGSSASGIDVPAGIYVIRMTTGTGDTASVRALKRP